MANEDRVAAIAAGVLAGKRYRTVAPDVVAEIASRAAQRYPATGDAIKAAKNTLHQIAGAFLDARMPYDRWLAELRASRADPQALREACRAIMMHHASSAERLPFLDAFYGAIFEGSAPVTSVLDLGCGLHPLAIHWMPLESGAAYDAIDIFIDQMEFLAEAMPMLGVDSTARATNLLGALPERSYDLVLLIKVLPALELLDHSALPLLARDLHAKRLAITLPKRSLGGRYYATADHQRRLSPLLDGTPWHITSTHAFPSEELFMLARAEEA